MIDQAAHDVTQGLEYLHEHYSDYDVEASEFLSDALSAL